MSATLRLPKATDGTQRHVVASEADHEPVLKLLRSAFPGFDREAFHTVVTDPFYRARDRMLVKVGDQVVSHVQLARRQLRYGSVQLPVGDLIWLAALPQYRQRGYVEQLVQYAENQARQQGLVLVLLSTPQPAKYEPLGYTQLGSPCLSRAPAGRLPHRLDNIEPEIDPDHERPPTLVQPWRQDQVPALMSVYDAAYAPATVSMGRSERYWEWLISREKEADIWLAQEEGRPAGYAFVRGATILEIAHHPAHPSALTALLARIRIEALDRSKPEATVYAPPGHVVHQWFRRGGGQTLCQPDTPQPVWMAKVTDFELLLTAILPELTRCASQADLALPAELGLVVGRLRCRLHLDRQAGRIESGRTGRSYLTATATAATRLIFGQSSLSELVAAGQIEPSSQQASRIAAALFPARTFWRSPLDLPTE